MYYSIEPLTSYNWELEIELYNNLYKKYIVDEECKKVVLPYVIPDLHLRYMKADSPLSYIGGRLGLGVIKNEFLDLLNIQEIDKYLIINKLFYKGKKVEQYSSFRGKYPIRIRGGEKSLYKKCSKCGSELTFPVGDNYVLMPNPSDLPIYTCGFNIVISEEVYLRIKNNKFNKIHIRKLPVFDEPKDRLPINLIF